MLLLERVLLGELPADHNLARVVRSERLDDPVECLVGLEMQGRDAVLEGVSDTELGAKVLELQVVHRTRRLSVEILGPVLLHVLNGGGVRS